MKIILFFSVLLLTGCSIFKQPVPIKRNFPEPYSVGIKKEEPKCQPLLTQEGDNIPITEFLKTIVQNYSLYYQCSNHVDNWNQWYKEQKEIFEKSNK